MATHIKPDKIYEGRATIRMFNVDNRDFMNQVDDNYYGLSISDPPYGIVENGQRNVTGDRPTEKWKNPTSKTYKPFDDTTIPQKESFESLQRISKNQIVWGGNYFTQYLEPSKGWIVWDKKADIKEHLSMCELAWSSFDKKCNKFEYLWAGFKKKKQVERIHVTQKPINLYRWILKNYAEPNQKIFDGWGGSMSIAIACWDLGFDLDICELDEDYFNDAVKRFESHIAQTQLF